MKDQAFTYYIQSHQDSIDEEEFLRLRERCDSLLKSLYGLRLIADFTANDSLMMLLTEQWVIFNRYKYAPAFYSGSLTTGHTTSSSLFFVESYREDLMYLANDMRIFGADEPSLMGKICVMQDVVDHLDNLNALSKFKGIDADSVLAVYMSKMKTLLNDANLSARADLIYKDFIRSQAPYWDLPDYRITR